MKSLILRKKKSREYIIYVYTYIYIILKIAISVKLLIDYKSVGVESTRRSIFLRLHTREVNEFIIIRNLFFLYIKLRAKGAI